MTSDLILRCIHIQKSSLTKGYTSCYNKSKLDEEDDVPRKIRQLKADLRKAGAYQVSQEGSHTKWRHSLVATDTLILSGHDGDDAKPYQEKAVRTLLQEIADAKRRTQS